MRYCLSYDRKNEKIDSAQVREKILEYIIDIGTLVLNPVATTITFDSNESLEFLVEDFEREFKSEVFYHLASVKEKDEKGKEYEEFSQPKDQTEFIDLIEKIENKS